MKVNSKQLAAVLKLDGAKRYDHFIKVTADWQLVWGLYKDGWALAATEDGLPVFPIWPAKEYAEICAINTWLGYEPRSFSLESFIHELLPSLEKDKVLPGVFFTPDSKGVTPEIFQIKEDLENELNNY